MCQPPSHCIFLSLFFFVVVAQILSVVLLSTHIVGIFLYIFFFLGEEVSWISLSFFHHCIKMESSSFTQDAGNTEGAAAASGEVTAFSSSPSAGSGQLEKTFQLSPSRSRRSVKEKAGGYSSNHRSSDGLDSAHARVVPTTSAALVPPHRSVSSLSRKGGKWEGGKDTSTTVEALKRAQVIMRARYYSATQSAVALGETGIKDVDRVQSRVALSEGEALVLQRMITSEQHQKEVLERARATLEEKIARIAERNEAKQRRLDACEKEAEEQRQRCFSSRRKSMASRIQHHHEVRQFELERREEKMRKKMSHLKAMKYDPFAHIAARQRYRSPPPPSSYGEGEQEEQGKPPLRLNQHSHPHSSDEQGRAGGADARKGRAGSSSRKKTPRRWR